MEQHDAVEVITAKRDRRELSDSQIDWVIDAYTRGVVADEQMSALAMAILLNGMSRREVSRWTSAMIASGERMDFSRLSRPTADKHSTGGVGDKITLPLAPLVAACGVAVPQLSGRGLGHTGGTLDKLESVPGWQASLSNEAMWSQLEDVGAVICAAGSGLAPADRKLYALRDVTGTVEAMPLIASSIMSKKIAEGTGALVLDVKVGSGAFMKELDTARELAETMVALGADAGVNTVALLTDMSTPLGLTAGNALEVRESVEVLAGGGPADVVELTLALAREMLEGAGVTGVDPDAERIERAEERARARVMPLHLTYQQGPLDDLPHETAVFDAAIGEPVLSSAADPEIAVAELVRVTKPMGTVVLLQPTWSSEIPAATRELLVERLGLRPHFLVEWKQMLRDAGAVALHIEDLTDAAAAPDQPLLGVAGLVDFYSLRDPFGVLLRAWRRWGWSGVWEAVLHGNEVRRLIARERVLGLAKSPPAFVQFAFAAVQGGIAVVQAVFDAADLRPAGPDLGLRVVLELEGRLLGRELSLPA